MSSTSLIELAADTALILSARAGALRVATDLTAIGHLCEADDDLDLDRVLLMATAAQVAVALTPYAEPVVEPVPRQPLLALVRVLREPGRAAAWRHAAAPLSSATRNAVGRARSGPRSPASVGLLDDHAQGDRRMSKRKRSHSTVEQPSLGDLACPSRPS